MFLCDKTTGTGGNPHFYPFSQGGKRKAFVSVVFLDEGEKEVVEADAENALGILKAYFQRECGYKVSSAQEAFVLDAGDGKDDCRVGVSVNIYRNAEEPVEE